MSDDLEAAAARIDAAITPDTERWVREFQPAADGTLDAPPDLEPRYGEIGLADRFAERAQGMFRWSCGMDWMLNRGDHWERDLQLKRYTLAQEVCTEAAQGLGERAADRISTAKTANAILTLARPAPGISTVVDEWDAHPMLLNTPAGVIDLRTGQEVPRAGLLFTQVTAVAPEPTPTPRWEQFLAEVFDHDLQLVEFVQRMAGYLLTGSTVEQKLFFLFGTGANGKSVFLDVLRSVCGAYAHNLPTEALMVSRHEQHPTVLASLQGKRLAISGEVEENARWAESRIKSLTGDETLTARYMRMDYFTFRLTHKHVIAGNFKPRLQGDDLAMVRRLVLIPFAQRFEGTRRDSSLPERLKAEYPGILAWAIEGARKWAASGLAIPPTVTQASQDYMSEQNDMEQWIADCCVRLPQAVAATSVLYRSFAKWKEANGEHAPSVRSFSQRLERMFKRVRTAHVRGFAGLTIAQPEPADEPAYWDR